LRLALGLVAVWFVYWTCANVLAAPSAEGGAAPGTLASGSEIAIVIVAVIVALWTALGFRGDTY